ncbi:acylphosphatase [Roseomonas sp. OT10]|uniref:acylphosphatase n=1 Tax=Roseomonas cutis TaxID=2897332 RepID=UPI001E5F3A51|nr:acylphosphatase [Roseomonas sp. OT10]UFN51147.1 acylphosphatase [Roseomonas sp. OT10]
MSARRLRIRGRVQGVGYRDWLLGTARAHGLAGWVRNRLDGSVEALLSGDEDAVREVVNACRRGPPLARVDELDESFADPPDGPGFLRQPTA